MSFGISGLNHPSLIKNFYPENLPPEWYLEYYSNEFELLLTSQDELSGFDDLEAVLDDKDFQCLTNINSHDMNETEAINGIQWQWSKGSKVNGDGALCIIQGMSSSTPKNIKELLVLIRKTAQERNTDEVYVVFEDDNALDNCRNAVVLQSMM